MDNGLTLADIAAVTKDSEGFGSGSGAWVLILLFAMIFGWGNGGFGGNSETLTQGDLQRAIDLNSIQNGQRDIEARVQEVGSENLSQMKDGQYNMLSELRDIQAADATGFANMQKCCCETNQAIMENRYLAEKNAASVTAAVHSEGEATRALIQQNKIEALQQKVSALELANATAGVVKYPMNTTYSVASPCFNGCGM